MGGHLAVIWQPWEFVIICGIGARHLHRRQSLETVVGHRHGASQAIPARRPKERHYLDLLGVLHALMRELRGKGRNEVEAHIDDPASSAIFKAFPSVLANTR